MGPPTMQRSHPARVRQPMSQRIYSTPHCPSAAPHTAPSRPPRATPRAGMRPQTQAHTPLPKRVAMDLRPTPGAAYAACYAAPVGGGTRGGRARMVIRTATRATTPRCCRRTSRRTPSYPRPPARAQHRRGPHTCARIAAWAGPRSARWCRKSLTPGGCP